MKNLSPLILILFVFITGCSKDEETTVIKITYEEQLAIDTQIIDDYLSANGITAIVDSSGLRYVVQTEGLGYSPTISNTVKVKYEGRLLSDNSVFDSNSAGVSFPLNRLIKGWQIGLTKMAEGGKSILYIPSGLAYGTSGSGAGIPTNSNLIFDIELVEVIN
jgi:FKBP-type peptidyl-prolyl cis-trans isomerase FkpA